MRTCIKPRIASLRAVTSGTGSSYSDRCDTSRHAPLTSRSRTHLRTVLIHVDPPDPSRCAGGGSDRSEGRETTGRNVLANDNSEVQGNEVRATFVDDKKFGITFGGVPGNDPGSSRILKIDPAGMAAQQPQVRADPTCIGTRIAGSLASCIYPLLRYF